MKELRLVQVTIKGTIDNPDFDKSKNRCNENRQKIRGVKEEFRADFHMFVQYMEYDENSSGDAHCMAIVEKGNGEVREVGAECIRFLDK